MPTNLEQSSEQEIAHLTARDFDTVTVGDEIGPKEYQLTHGDLVNYAGVSGDNNPIHFSYSIADLMGLDNIIAHGMLTMGIGLGLITNWLGDPRAVLDFQTRFTSPVYVPADKPGFLEFSAKVKSLDPTDRTGVIVLTGKQDGRRIYGNARATVQFS